MSGFWDGVDETLCAIQAVYVTSMRGSMFTGFLTMCSFLMAAKTFLVTNLKQEVYGKEEYLEFYLATADHPATGAATSVNAPLKTLSDRLMVNVVLALVTCVAQFTIGLLPHWSAALACLALAAVTIGALVRTLFQMRSNLAVMFAWMDVAADKKLAKLKSEKK